MIATILRYFLGLQQNLTHTKYIIVELVCLSGFRAHIRTYFFVQPGQPHTFQRSERQVAKRVTIWNEGRWPASA